MTGVLTEPLQATLRLVEPLLGFEDRTDFDLTPIDAEGVLFTLRSTGDPGLRFVLTPAECFFEDYRPELGDGIVSALGAESEADLSVFVMLTITDKLADATANLRAPLITARPAATALQVVLDDDSLSMHQPLLPRVDAG